MTKTIILIMLMVCWACPVMAKSKHEIVIGGDHRFKKQVNLCLDLLQKKYPESYKFVNQYIGVISKFSRSGMRAWENPPRYQMSETTAFYSITWCASTIAHDAYHSYLYQKFKPSNGATTPSHYWADQLAEQKAINYQIKVAKKIGSSDHELKYLKSLDGSHADVDGDGQVTYEDYLNRSW